MIELVCKKFGEETRIELFSDGSGFIYQEYTTRLDKPSLQFDGLGELAEELEE